MLLFFPFSRNGPEFEARIRQNEINNPKFNFLNPNDPYHAYYRHKVSEFKEGKAQEPSAAIPKVMQQQQQATQQQLPQKVGASPSLCFPRAEGGWDREGKIMNSAVETSQPPREKLEVFIPVLQRQMLRLTQQSVADSWHLLNAPCHTLCSVLWEPCLIGASQGLHEEASKVTIFQMRNLRLREAQFTQGHRVRTLKSVLSVPTLFLDHGMRAVLQCGLWTPSSASLSTVSPSQGLSFWPALIPP